MSRAKLDGEGLVQKYLMSVDLRAERFEKHEMRNGKTPDFRVFRGDELAFYCEVKTSQEDEWLKRRLADAPPLTLVGGVRPDPTYNRIANYVHTSVAQFDAVNQKLERPNVLAIVNGDSHVAFDDLISVLTGDAYCESGEVIPMFCGYSEGRIREEKLRVHLYLWFNDWKPTHCQKFFPEFHSAHHAALCGYFNLDPATIDRLPNVPRI